MCKPFLRDCLWLQDAVRIDNMCIDCGLKQTGYGMLGDKKRKWCASCGAKHGAVYLSRRKGEKDGVSPLRTLSLCL